MFNFTAPLPLALYVHFPWCLAKCPYCDFNSHSVHGTIPEAAYLAALVEDLETMLPRVWGRAVGSVFIGGGTPSLLSPEGLARLLSDLRARLMLTADVEITLEANPGTVEQGRFAEFRDAGINRLSLGIQSFQDELLHRLGRVHNAGEARHAAETARRAGFDNLNVDLMYGLPGQSVAEAETDLAEAIALEPTHLSRYQLTIEPNTAFGHAPPALPKEDTIAAMEEAGHTRLADNGFEQYEVSAFARAGFRCRHNLNYWQFGDYLGIGAGAHGKITEPQRPAIVRLWKERHPQHYMEAGAARTAGERALTNQDAAFEFMLNALRLSDGFETALFADRTGQPVTAVERPLAEAERRGLIEWNVQHIRPTERGRRFLNDLLELFLPA